MKVVAIGAGSWGRNIVRDLHEMDLLAGIVEVNPRTVEDLRQRYPETPVFTTPEEAYSAVDPDAVTVAVPAPLHFEVAAVALERGYHCFVEKPFTRDLREAEALVRLAETEDRNLVLMAGLLLLHQPAVVFMKQAIEEGAIGELVSIHAERLNLGRAQPKESVLWSKGLHDISVALYLTGQTPDRVVCTATSTVTLGIEDDAYVHMEFPGGTMANLHTSWIWPTLRRRTVVVGTEAMLVYVEVENKVYLHRKKVNPDLTATNGGDELVFHAQAEPLREELKHFVASVESGSRPRGDGRTALEVLRVLHAASDTHQ